MNEKRPQRRKYYVSPLIQGRLITRMAGYWCVYHLFLWHAMFLYRVLQYRDAVAAGAPEVPWWNLYTSFVVDNSTMLICAVLVFPLILWDMIHLTHRVAGPLVRFQNTLRRMSEGEDVKEVKLREGDLLDELRDAFNDYLDSLHEMKPSDSQPAVETVAPVSTAAIEPAAPLAVIGETLMPQPEPERVEPKASKHLPTQREVAVAKQNSDSDDFDAILHDLRDIQSTLSRVKVESPAGSSSFSPRDELRLD
ncbi:MAG: hypothetical protein AB7O26_14035 [Planctomycetaceae bacterium]